MFQGLIIVYQKSGTNYWVGTFIIPLSKLRVPFKGEGRVGFGLLLIVEVSTVMTASNDEFHCLGGGLRGNGGKSGGFKPSCTFGRRI